MNHAKSLLATAILMLAGIGAAQAATEGGITKEQAIQKALAEHPGTVEKAYMEKKKGADVWEVKLKGDDGKKWEIYYDVKSGELVKVESK